MKKFIMVSWSAKCLARQSLLCHTGLRCDITTDDGSSRSTISRCSSSDKGIPALMQSSNSSSRRSASFMLLLKLASALTSPYFPANIGTAAVHVLSTLVLTLNLASIIFI